MQDIDVLLKAYLSDDDRFADLVNGCVFGGERVVSAENLAEMDSQLNLMERFRKRKLVKRFRDMVRKVAFDVNFAVIGVENQEKIHYAMPLRVMNYDTGNYEEQVRGIGRLHRRRRDLSGDEFLSGFSGKDRLKPVVSLVLYYGEKPWDGPKSLFDMVEWEGIPEALQELAGDYRMNLIEVRKFEGTEWFRTDLKQVFSFIQASGSKERWKRVLEEQRDKFSEMEEDAYDLVCLLTGAGELEQKKTEYRTEGGKIDMCQALTELLEDSKNEGKLEGKQEGEDRFGRLTLKLLKEKRYKELELASKDSRVRNRLYREFKL